MFFFKYVSIILRKIATNVYTVTPRRLIKNFHKQPMSLDSSSEFVLKLHCVLSKKKFVFLDSENTLRVSH